MKDVKRKKGESFEAFMRRTRRDWRSSGILSEIKRRRFFEPKRSKNVEAAQAVRKVKVNGKQDYLVRTGRIPAPEDRQFGRGRGRR